MYAVVEFSGENDESGCSMIEIIPLGWLRENEKLCYWPPYRNSLKIAKCVKNHVDADSTWTSCTVKRVMYKTDSYLKAREKLRQAEEVSDLQTSDISDSEVSKKRIKRPVARYADFDSDSDDSSPPSKKRTQSAPLPPPLIRTSSAQNPEELKRKLLESDQRIDDSFEFSNDDSFSEKTCASQNTSTSVQKQILCGIEHVKLQLANVLAVLQNNSQNPSNPIKLPSNVSFPLNDMESLQHFEDVLKDKDKTVQNNLVQYLGSIGGKDISTTVRHILVHCVSNKLALQFNMKGKGKKHAFTLLGLNEIIQRAVRRNHITASATDADINAVTADWLRFAKDRDGGRKERERKKWEAQLLSK
uniref:Inactive serine/threonine-protein kinase VRK3 n=1 Tax=Phallusia mammillata TaxID=59560 RepID=A0A6F9DXA3_9ASCI|nr:inactive serine/threonine-protein kinase VRK3 [Phallusia mammillata]